MFLKVIGVWLSVMPVGSKPVSTSSLNSEPSLARPILILPYSKFVSCFNLASLYLNEYSSLFFVE